MASQWENFLKNLGNWRGSFAGVNLDGEITTEVPSILTLSLIDGNRDKVLFTLRRFENGGYDSEPTSNMSQEFTGLGRHTMFFDTGSFSKGSMCLSSISSFIAEYGFIKGDRRMRMVQMYGDAFTFNKLVFIREFREGSNAQERPPLTVEQLLGTWEAEYHVYTPDLDPPKMHQSRLTLSKEGDYLHQTLELEHQAIASKGQIQGNTIRFTEGSTPRNLVLLPDGASMNVPPQLAQRQAFFVEAGWLVSDNERQRIMRNYNDRGEWVSSTLIFERRVA
ncbi:DUF3598 family protein [Picosynechococcus sp. NKBG042902]|uniref:DUF3598 family protein n=1 Tax=Picosynechococcus sp. NKBG042902 TaxID=490193 RepID=UPI0004AA20F3|nr:DUF3598 family protein [Picosynechococcus sp. NKBG042902]